jgi:uncharacterized integral membrane protein
MLIFLFLGLIIGAAAVVFVLQNVVPITVTFLSWHLSGSLAVILLLALLCGMLICALILLPGIVGTQLRLRKMVKLNQKLQSETTINETPRASGVTEPAPVEREPDIDLNKESQ